ncbi:hypothetical protein AKJ09_05021 [Labilithrix luteola]|uniref:Uncharacterized protein n=1 Tax=Labilithrix luteola TaxID=1391654 RepID=A0A0K1PXW9_9BACT|nr:hypothetical protein [Labilithrix luteola]AKU98357.1 hypothetical protein AKJ09_05021 [Labilithrix luteola]
MGATEHTLGSVTVVRSAKDAEVIGLAAAAQRPGRHVVDFEKRARWTPFAVLADERTLHAVTLERFPATGGSSERLATLY